MPRLAVRRSHSCRISWRPVSHLSGSDTASAARDVAFPGDQCRIYWKFLCIRVLAKAARFPGGRREVMPSFEGMRRRPIGRRERCRLDMVPPIGGTVPGGTVRCCLLAALAAAGFGGGQQSRRPIGRRQKRGGAGRCFQPEIWHAACWRRGVMPSIDGAVSCCRSAARKGRAIARSGSGGGGGRGVCAAGPAIAQGRRSCAAGQDPDRRKHAAGLDAGRQAIGRGRAAGSGGAMAGLIHGRGVRLPRRIRRRTVAAGPAEWCRNWLPDRATVPARFRAGR